MAELVQAIIKDEPIKMRKLADIFHVNIDDLQIMWVFSLDDKHDENYANYISIMQNTMEEYRLRYISDVIDNKVVIFIRKPSYPIDLCHLVESFTKAMKDENKEIIIAMLPKLSDMSQAREMYYLFRQHINCAKKVFLHKALFSFKELLFVKTCQNIIEQGEDTVQQHFALLYSLHPEDKQWQQELINTLCAFLLDVQSSVLKTAELTYLHKSTIKYRIKSMNEALGYSVQKMPESYPLFLAAAIKRLLN